MKVPKAMDCEFPPAYRLEIALMFHFPSLLLLCFVLGCTFVAFVLRGRCV